MNTDTQLFDRKFITSASLIGTFYAAIVVGLGTLLGKEAAGVASVALAALATAIFKQFETLRFRQLAEQEGHIVSIPRLSLWYIILLAFGFCGIQLFTGVLFGAAIMKFNLIPDLSSPESFFDLLNDRKILISLVGLNSAAHFLGGFVCGKTAPSVRFTYAVIASLLSLFLSLLIPVLGMVAGDISRLKMFLDPSLYVFSIFWLLYLAASLLGAKLGFPKTTLINADEA